MSDTTNDDAARQRLGDALESLLAPLHARRQADAERFRALDWDTCQLCHAHGEDKRTLTLDCFYAVNEMVPEAIDLSGLANEERWHGGPGMLFDTDRVPLPERGWLLRLCKSCRGRLLGHLKTWRGECVARRGRPMDHDGNDDDSVRDPERNIPVRTNGVVEWLTRAEWDERDRAARGQGGA